MKHKGAVIAALTELGIPVYKGEKVRRADILRALAAIEQEEKKAKKPASDAKDE